MQLCTQNLVVKTTVTTTEGLKENLSRGDPPDHHPQSRQRTGVAKIARTTDFFSLSSFSCMIINHFLIQELLVTHFVILTVVNHLQLAIKIMITRRMQTVPVCAKELGGTRVVTNLT